MHLIKKPTQVFHQTICTQYLEMAIDWKINPETRYGASIPASWGLSNRPDTYQKVMVLFNFGKSEQI